MNTWKKSCRKLFKTETPRFFSLKLVLQPSFLLASICLLLGALPLLAFREEPDRTEIEKLKKLGWRLIEESPCPHTKADHFYEIDYGIKNRELFVTENNAFLLSPGDPMEAENPHCHPIKQPSFVEEI